jgi:hypothetical protein
MVRLTLRTDSERKTTTDHTGPDVASMVQRKPPGVLSAFQFDQAAAVLNCDVGMSLLSWEEG